MAENKKVVLLYCDLIHTVEELDDNEAGKLFKHYLRYINDLNPVAPDKLTQIVFEPIKQTLKRDLKKWEDEKAQRSEAGKKGMQKRWNNNESITDLTRDNNVIDIITENNSVIKNITNITDKVKVRVKDSVKEKDIEREREIKNFPLPTILDINEYCKANMIKLSEGKRFFDYWTARNWIDTKDNPVTNWKSKAVSWFNDDHKEKVITNPNMNGMIM